MPRAWNIVYNLVKRIPKGRVITYGSIARACKLRGGAREAGHAMAACPQGRGIPWHRVVGAGGRLLIREPYASLQKRLLESEGALLVGSRISMEEHEWTVPRRRKPLTRKRRRRTS
jgi:methylated-DNA-protein-cysteine methyltransferase-like protein